jgi:hypothetical protein
MYPPVYLFNFDINALNTGECDQQIKYLTIAEMFGYY